MSNCARRRATACLVCVALLTLATPAAAMPRGDASSSFALAPVQLVEDLVAWLAGWLGETPLQSLSARGGHAIDPDAPPSPDPGDGGTVSTQGGGAIDPDG